MNKGTEKQYDNFFGYIAHVFTSNIPLSIIVLFSAIIVGSMLYISTPKQYNPEVIRPAFVVATEYRGAKAQDVKNFVSQSLSNSIKEIPGIDEVQSQSIGGGMSLVTALFHVGENEEDSKTKLFTKIMENTEIRKPGISNPYIKSINPNDVPIVTLNVSSDNLDQNKIREKIYEHIDELKRINDVSQVIVYGGQAPALVVELDITKIDSLGISLPQIIQILEKNNQRKISPDLKTGYRKISLELDNTFSDVDSVKNISIAKGIHLSDLAHVYVGYSEKDSFTEYNEKGSQNYQNVFISFSKKKGSSAPVVSKEIQSQAEKIFKSESDVLNVKILRDNGKVANKEINGLMMNLLISIGIIGIILYLFLSGRSALIVMGAIPIILLLVFIPGYLAGQTINRITLFALILSLGLLVDSATVVVENIYRNIKNNPEISLRKNTVSAVGQVGVGLVLSTLTSVVVFFPVKFISGMMGPYMGPIAFFVPVALTISLLTAFVITPFLAYQSFKKKKKESKPILDNLFKKISGWYEKKISVILKNRETSKKILLGLLVLFVLSLMLPMFKLVHFQMLPKADKDQLYVHVDLPTGTDILKTKIETDKIIEKINTVSDVKSIQIFTGTAPIPDFNGLFKGVQSRSESHQSTIRVNFNDKHKSSIKLASKIRKEINSIDLPLHTVVKVLEDPPGPPVQATFVLEVFGENEKGRNYISSEIKTKLSEVKGLVDIDSSQAESFERIVIDVDQDYAQELGISMDMLYALFQTSTDAYSFSQFHNGKREYAQIEISLPRRERKSIDDILEMKIPNSFGKLVAVSEFTNIKHTKNDDTYYEKNSAPYTFITGEVDNRSIVYVVLDTFKILKKLELEGFEVKQTSLNSFSIEHINGDSYELKIDGEWNMTLNNFRDLGIAMIAALFLVYAILVAQYKSFIVPGLIMVTIPLGLMGILIGFTFLDIFFNVYLTATALIGFIALIGIVVNNAILYLEHFTELVQSNPEIDHKDALIEAGRVRLRPIMLTSLTTILANLTIVTDPVWSGLAWAIIFGLSLSTVMTLVVFPVLYVYFDAHK